MNYIKEGYNEVWGGYSAGLELLGIICAIVFVIGILAFLAMFVKWEFCWIFLRLGVVAMLPLPTLYVIVGLIKGEVR